MASRAVLEASSKALGLYMVAGAAIHLVASLPRLLSAGPGRRGVFLQIEALALPLVLIAGAWYFLRHAGQVAARLAGNEATGLDPEESDVLAFQEIATRAVGLFLLVGAGVRASGAVFFLFEIGRSALASDLPGFLWGWGCPIILQLLIGRWVYRSPAKAAAMFQRVFGATAR